MNRNNINFDNNKIKKATLQQKQKNFNIDDIDVNKILVSKKNNMANIIHLSTLLDIMIMIWFFFSIMAAWRVDAFSSHSIPDILQQFVYYLYSLKFEIYIESNIHLIKGNQIYSSY